MLSHRKEVLDSAAKVHGFSLRILWTDDSRPRDVLFAFTRSVNYGICILSWSRTDRGPAIPYPEIVKNEMQLDLLVSNTGTYEVEKGRESAEATSKGLFFDPWENEEDIYRTNVIGKSFLSQWQRFLNHICTPISLWHVNCNSYLSKTIPLIHVCIL